VEIVWRPVSSTHPEDLTDEISQGIASIHRHRPPGHILVFLPGEGLIHRISTAVEELCLGPDLVIFPLYGRLTREEQERVFDDLGNKRKVVLATNIAETSITVPDVRYVIDTGLAKVPRFKPKSGITQLREEPISRSSILQRTGRAGRTGPGVVFRLFSEASLDERPDRTEEEIRRLDLAEVVLRLLDLGIDNVEDFHFPTPPPGAKVHAALEHLQALGAVDEKRALTRVGRRMAPFPLSPALARMVIEAAERFESVVDDVLVVGAFMSGRSPWLIPEGEFDAARRAHARLHHAMGDACSELAVYRSWERAKDKDRFCRRNYLDPEVMQFAHKAHGQLREIAEKQGIELRGGGSAESLVKAIATGLADKVLRRDENAYETIHGARVALHPGSALVRNPPDFAVAAELVAYARPYAINVSVMRPSWVAKASPKAAQAFGLGRARASGRKRPVITELELGGITFDVSSGQGKPTIEIGLEQIAAVRQADPDDLPPAARKLRGRVRWTEKHSFAALPLPKLLRVLRFSPFPAPGSRPPENLQLGDLHSYDRGRHYVERDLARLLEPAVQGKTAGWVALVASGGGACWLDVVFHYIDAIETSLVSLDDLQGELYPGDELLDRVVEVQRRLRETLDATRAV
jgi:HrpA-like RNA helicase